MKSTGASLRFLRCSLHRSECDNRLSCMKTPQHLNRLDAFRELSQNWHRFQCAASESGELLPVLAARIRALCAPRLQGRNRKDRLSDFLGSLCDALEADPAGRDHVGGNLPEGEFMARFAQELAQWPCGPTEFSATPASQRCFPPELINTEVQELDIAGACRPPARPAEWLLSMARAFLR